MAAALIPLLTTILPGILDKVIPDRNAAEKAANEIITQTAGALERSDERQAKVNEAEVSNGKGGWRHAAAMLCVYSLGYSWLARPAMVWVLALVEAYTGKPLPPLPVVDIEMQFTMLTGLLGLAGLRTFDLRQGTRK